MNAPAASFRLDRQGGALRLIRLDAGGLAVDALMTGRPLAEVERLLPAVFGLCRSVQETALALALARPAPDAGALRRDMIRDHLARLCLHLPRALNLPVRPLPQAWAEAGQALRHAILGADTLPGPSDFTPWLQGGTLGIAPLLQQIDRLFAPGEGAALLPALDPAHALDGQALENSLITRHENHPLLAHVTGLRGRGPLAHLVARLIDLDALSHGRMPAPYRLADGTAVVPCSRGICTLGLVVEDGIVTRFHRRTPTDHLLMPGGLFEQAINSLGAAKAGLAPLLTAVLDPCMAVDLRCEDA